MFLDCDTRSALAMDSAGWVMDTAKHKISETWSQKIKLETP